jgi:O-antigen/teichoic acid export membrane protein
MAVPVALLAKPIINILFGAQYLAAAPILQIYIWSSLGLFIGSGVGSYLTAENKTKTIFGINFFAMLINIALNLILIPKYGLVGAAWATLVAYSIMPLWLLTIRKKTYEI